MGTARDYWNKDWWRAGDWNRAAMLDAAEDQGFAVVAGEAAGRRGR